GGVGWLGRFDPVAGTVTSLHEYASDVKPKSGFLAVGEDLWFATEKGGSGNGSIEKLSLPGGTVTWVADLEVATGIKVESFAHDGAGHLYFAPREGGDLAEVGGKGAGTVRRLDLSSRGITTVVTLKNAEHGSKVRNLLFWQGQLWWVCEEGGDLSLEGGKGGGTLMSCDPATGGVQRRHLFDGTTGLKPKGLALAGGDLYFTTEKGGAENLGVFGVARGGTNVSVLQDLGVTTGAKPDHQLSVLGNRLLFATENGGSGFLGTILSYTLPSAPEILTLEVDAQRSHLELAPTVFDGIEFSPGQPQGAGALRAPVGGTIQIERSAAGVRFLTGSRLVVGNGGTWTPGRYVANPDNPREFNPTPAAASFGYRFTSPFEFLVAARDLVFAVISETVHPLAGASLSSSNLTVTIASGVGHLTLGNPPVSDLTTYPPTVSTDAGTGTLSEAADGSVELTLPVAFAWEIEAGLLLRSAYTGVLVARTPGGAGEPPRLTASVSEAGLLLSWPAPGAGAAWRLESAETLGGVWSPVTAEAVIQDGTARVGRPVSEAGGWFRLVSGQ
ncbi:MAG: hypothetical protein J0L84_00460, partial [Verrucomicrobia bacterium]|nr:hypothetical protein [Verrucomicrobiota bacterium]